MLGYRYLCFVCEKKNLSDFLRIVNDVFIYFNYLEAFVLKSIRIRWAGHKQNTVKWSRYQVDFYNNYITMNVNKNNQSNQE